MTRRSVLEDFGSSASEALEIRVQAELYRDLLQSIEENMKPLDVLLERNKAFAALQIAAGTLMPSLSEAVQHLKAIIVACADMRADPTDVLGLNQAKRLFCGISADALRRF